MRLKRAVIYYFLLTIVGTLNLKASKIEDAFEALRIFDYFKAKKLFHSQLKKDNKAPAAFGLATIFYRSDNPFHNNDSASKYITIAGNYLGKTLCEYNLSGFTIDSTTVFQLADSIASKAFDKASQSNSIFQLERFILENPYASLKKKNAALFLRDEISFQQCNAYNTIDSTKATMLRFPESYFYYDLTLLLDKQVFDLETSLKTPSQLIAFIAKHPSNKFLDQAMDELFDLYKKSKTISELDYYVKNYPKSHFINEAWKLLYALSVKSYNTNELQAFVQKYPSFPFKASINKEIELNTKVLIPVNHEDYTGFIDTSGRFVIPAMYDAATPFQEGLSVVVKNDTSYFVNKENENVFNTFYSEAYPFINGIAPVNIGGQWFLINRQGQKTNGPFEELSEQSENIYVVKQNNKYGAIDIYGNYIIQPQLDKIGDFKNGAAYYISNGHYGFLRKNGTSSHARYQWISDFDENKLAIVKLNNAYGITNFSDSLILSPKYDLIVKAKNNVFILVKNNKYGFFHGSGCFLSEIDYDFRKELSADFYTNGKLFKLIKKNKQALMDPNGKLTIDYGTFEEVNFAQDNLIRIKRNGKYGFVDRKLAQVVPAKYVSATDFNNGISVVSLKKEMMLINSKGDEFFKTKGVITPITESYFLVKEEEGDKVINVRGELVISGVEGYHINRDGYLILDLENNSKKVVKL
jgi:hypothetical protein